MVHDAEVARNNFVLQHGAGWNVDPVSVVSNDDDGALGGRGGGKLILKSFFLTALLSIMMKDYKVSSRSRRRMQKGFLNNRMLFLKVSQWVSSYFPQILSDEIKILWALTLSETFFPKVTSPETVRWSSSSMSGMLSKRVRYS